MSPNNLVRLMVLAVSVWGIVLGDETARPSAADAGDVGAELQRAVASYKQAFNGADAQAIGRLWSARGVYENRDTGERIVGREAIVEDMVAVFKERPDARLDINLRRVRLIQPDVARLEGESEVARSGQPDQRACFSAIYVRRDGQWLIDTVEEYAPRSPQTTKAALAPLEWMIGRWVDQSDEVSVETDVRWAPGGAFLIRSYAVTSDEASHRGTQVIGWDPIREQVRSWVFDSDGGFGEGVWSGSGDEWFVRNTFTTSSGDLVSGTQVMTRRGDGRLEVRSVGQEINGEPQPSKAPVIVQRVKEQPGPQPPEIPQGVQR